MHYWKLFPFFLSVWFPSFSEPSLFTTNENLLFEELSLNRRPSVLQKRPPPRPSFSKSSSVFPYKTSQPHQEVSSCSRPTFIHLSHAIQPSSRPRPVRRHSHNLALSSDMLHGDFRPSASQYKEEPLSVVGKPCLLTCSQRPAAGPARTQIHVFLPSEAEGEEADRESVDEGFMDELDSKITSLKLQQEAPKTNTPHTWHEWFLHCSPRAALSALLSVLFFLI